jgi:tetratricopeptide (TPR) repeat protein
VPDLFQDEEAKLAALGQTFLSALAAREAGRLDAAEDALRDVLKEEPRLAEPRLELARILLDTDRVEDAEAEAREALEQLERTGPWTDELPPNVVHALAHGLLAEILRRRADEDDVIFGDADQFRAIVAESRQHFERAAALDPSDEYSSYHAYFLGVGQAATEPDDA